MSDMLMTKSKKLGGTGIHHHAISKFAFSAVGTGRIVYYVGAYAEESDLREVSSRLKAE
ncbi:unnamed protein product [Dovyalis caffra]|uniref:Uncharacterized protein n=1 Tax=Dovyalis caffra TaxID=77055 RepID=A0AAV1RP98_9ROSI|nr:unnamed protein product [Dovyalis caffra]